MAQPKKTASTRGKKSQAPQFAFRLTHRDIVGIGVVLLCLFLWMFLIGVWAGKTIISSSTPEDVPDYAVPMEEELFIPEDILPEELLELEPHARKRRVAPVSYEEEYGDMQDTGQ